MTPQEAATPEQDVPQPAWTRERKKDILECPLAPDSLVGSYIQRLWNEEVAEQGVVVGEPQPGMYLVELNWYDAPSHQRVIPLTALADPDNEWRFYDTAEAMMVDNPAIAARRHQHET